MKRSKLFFILSVIVGVFAIILWVLRLWYPDDINILMPITLNVIQIGLALNINDN